MCVWVWSGGEGSECDEGEEGGMLYERVLVSVSLLRYQLSGY